MDKFKDALWLTLFEIRRSLVSYMLLLIVLIFFLVIIISSLPSYQETPVMALDFQFFFVICCLPAYFRGKSFKNTHVDNYVFATPFHLLIKQLPVNLGTYITYHLIYRFLYSMVITVLFLGIIYPFWKMPISFSQYAVFMLVWFTISYTFNMLDVYSQFGYHFFIGLAVIIVIVSFSFNVYTLLFFALIYRKGFVFWTLEMAVNHPVITSIFSILIIIGNILFWRIILKYKWNKVDFYK